MVKINTKFSLARYRNVTQLENFIPQITSVLGTMVHRHNRRYVHIMVKSYVQLLAEYEVAYGPYKALAFAKEFANIVKRRAMRLDCTFNYPFSVGTDESMIPRRLKRFSRFINSSSPVLRGVAISIANTYRVITLEPEVHYNDVLDGYKGETSEEIDNLMEYIVDGFAPSLKVDRELNDDTSLRQLRLMSSSPNGEKSLVSAHLCAHDLSHPSSASELTAVYCLYRAFRRQTDALNFSFLLDQFDELEKSHRIDDSGVKTENHQTTRGDIFSVRVYSEKALDKYLRPDKIKRLGKYSFISDKGGKTRGITLANYFIQSSLKTLHDNAMSVLAKIPFDFTYRQDKVPNHLENKFKEGKKAFCFDMKGATDRFPRFLQKKLVYAIYGEAVSEAWETVMLLPLWHANNLLRFSTGQPMGLLSSFCIFSLTHHALIQYCFRRHNEPPDYMILGDDIVIFDEHVGNTYYRILGTLGVEVSIQKSMLSREGNFSAEFCKRLCHNGKDITGLGSGLITTTRFDPSGLTSILDLMFAWYRCEKSQCYKAFEFSLAYFGKLLPKSLLLYGFFYLCYWDATPEVFRSYLRERLCLSGHDMDEFTDAFKTRIKDRLIERHESFEERIGPYYELLGSFYEKHPLGQYHPYVAVADGEIENLIEDREAVGDLSILDDDSIITRLEKVEVQEKLVKTLLKFKHESVNKSPEADRQETVRRFYEFASFAYSFSRMKCKSKLTRYERKVTPLWRRLQGQVIGYLEV